MFSGVYTGLKLVASASIIGVYATWTSIADLGWYVSRSFMLWLESMKHITKTVQSWADVPRAMKFSFACFITGFIQAKPELDRRINTRNAEIRGKVKANIKDTLISWAMATWYYITNFGEMPA